MKSPSRIVSIDATRGTAMLFVFLAHFANVYFRTSQPYFLYFLFKITMVATPTFVAISGLLLGFLYQINGNKFGMTRAKLLDRGLFLLTIGHLILNITMIPRYLGSGSVWDAARYMQITDIIAFCIIIGPLLMDKMKSVHRLVLGLSVYAISWLGIIFIPPENLALQFVKETFFGTYWGQNNIYIYSFPILPWFGFYLLNSYVGEKLGVYYLKKEDGKISKTCLTIACLALASAICTKTGYYLLNANEHNCMAYMLTSPFQKLPPSPVYLLFYGGVGYFILFFLFKFRNNSIINRYTEIMSVLGKTSFFVFILEAYVYYVILYYINLRLSVLWPIYFIISAIPMFPIAKIWDNKNLNRLITMGSQGFLSKRI